MKYVLKMGKRAVYLVIQKRINLMEIRLGLGNGKVRPAFKVPEVCSWKVD